MPVPLEPPEPATEVEPEVPLPSGSFEPRVRVTPVQPAASSLARPRTLARARPAAQVTRGPTQRPRRALDRDVKIVLELFAGKSELSTALRRQDFTVIAFEILTGAQFDLSRRSTQQAVSGWICAGRVEYVHLGVPCTVWSIARRGITDWIKARQKEEVSIALTMFTIEVYRECVRCGVPVSIENPLSSKNWGFFHDA